MAYNSISIIRLQKLMHLQVEPMPMLHPAENWIFFAHCCPRPSGQHSAKDQLRKEFLKTSYCSSISRNFHAGMK